jgi:hypothetical protein
VSARAPKKAIQVIGVRRPSLDLNRLADAVIALAQHLRDTAANEAMTATADSEKPPRPKETA